MTQVYLETTRLRLPRNRTEHSFRITNSVALPLSFRSLVEVLASELASCDRRPVYCLDGDIEM